MSSQLGSVTGQPLHIDGHANIWAGEQPAYILETVEDVAAHLARTAPVDPPNSGRPTGQRERAHREGKCTSPLTGLQPIFALLGYEDIRNLEGKLLTIVDASFQDREQRRAVKSLVRRAIWFEWVKYLDTDDVHVGMPNI